ncbi:MAG TPA: hypothetical protein VF189_04240 [Patescibacteria group bacterium]
MLEVNTQIRELAKVLAGDHLDLRGAHAAATRRPLRDVFEASTRRNHGPIVIAERYNGRGKDTKHVRLYLHPEKDYVPTVVIATPDVFETLKKQEEIYPKPYKGIVEDPFHPGSVMLSYQQIAELEFIKSALETEDGLRPNLLYAVRKTSYLPSENVVVKRGGYPVAKMRIFRHFQNPSEYTALVTGLDAHESLTQDIGTINITNASRVRQHRGQMQWERVE